GGLEIFGDDDAFAAGKAVGFDDNWRSMACDERLCGCRIAEAAVGRCRDLRAHAEILGEGLRRLDRGGRGARTEGSDPFGFECVDEPQYERRFRADDDEIDLLL